MWCAQCMNLVLLAHLGPISCGIQRSAGLTIIADVGIATGPGFLGTPRSSATNLNYYIIYKIFFNLRNQYFA